MSIDKHTGVVGGGAVSQFYRWLGAEWDKIDHCRDGCGIESVPRTRKGDLVTLTIGGNDLHMMQAHYLRVGLGHFVSAHRQLLRDLRDANPDALILVGNVYAPQFPLDPRRLRLLDEANEAIRVNIEHPGDRRPVDRHPRSLRRPRGPLALQADRAFARGRDAAREALPGGVHRGVAAGRRPAPRGGPLASAASPAPVRPGLAAAVASGAVMEETPAMLRECVLVARFRGAWWSWVGSGVPAYPYLTTHREAYLLAPRRAGARRRKGPIPSLV